LCVHVDSKYRAEHVYDVVNASATDYRLLATHAPLMGGVFSTSDLRALFDEGRSVALKRRIDALVAEELLARFCRGFYTTPQYAPAVLAARLNPTAYLSLGSILARELMIGAVPLKTVQCVKTGPSRAYESEALSVVCLGLRRELFFGFRVEDGLRVALPEKALLDTLYFHQHGHRFSFDIYSDIDLSRVNSKRLAQFLDRYRNPRFVRFARDYVDART